MEISSSTLNLNGKSLGFYARNSFLIHILFFLLCLAFGYYMNQVAQERKKFNLKLVESSVRVDIVAMPKLTVKELKALEKLNAGQPAVVEEPETIPDPEPVKPIAKVKGPEFIKEAKKVSFADMLKGYSEKKLPKKKVKAIKKKGSKTGEGGLSRRDRQALANLVKEGNQLKAGTGLTGNDTAEADQGAFVDYINQVREWVRPQWKLPSYLLEKELNCRIRIFINTSGKLLQAEIFESSGNQEYDAKALAAVKASNPFPGANNDIKSRVVGGDIVLGFPL